MAPPLHVCAAAAAATLSCCAAAAYAWGSGSSGGEPSLAAVDAAAFADSAASHVAFPGAAWYDKVATADTAYTAPDGITYSSAYSAIIYGDPASNPYRNFNEWINSFLISASFAGKVIDFTGSVETAHYLLMYLRNFVAGCAVYYITAGVFHYFCYVHPQSKEIYKDRVRPEWDIIWDQIKLAQASLFMYVGLPVFSDWLIEEGYTQTYYTLDEIGGFIPYAAFMLAYFTLVEIGIYWMHRTLHTNKFLYKHVHMLHHKYNRPDTLTPWASIAFNPLDGILQASPYVFWLPFIPCHYITHMILVFFTAVWATYIHDAMDWNVDPIMGSKYHTVHHTHYVYNYGQIFTFCDRFWGTLRIPVNKTGLVGEDGKERRQSLIDPAKIRKVQ